jgi:hypothetical protein
MEEEDGLAPNHQRATEGLEESLETCQKIVADYRSALLSLNGQSDMPEGDSPGA